METIDMTREEYEKYVKNYVDTANGKKVVDSDSICLKDAPSLDCKCADPENVIHHRRICSYLNDLYARKNKDYGDSFHLSYLEEGIAAARFRIGDKFSRFKKVSREGSQQVQDETLRDTLLDMANYCIMTAMEMDREAENDRR